MRESKSPLDRAVAVLRTESQPTPGARERIRARLAVQRPDIDYNTVALGNDVVDTRAAVGPRTPAASYARAFALFVVGGVVGALLHAAFARPAVTVAYVERPAHAPPVAIPTPLAEKAEATPASASVTVTGRVPAPLARSPSAVTAPTASELRLLDAARRALVRGDVAQALELLRLHQRTFPNGLLSDERDALFVESLVKAGRSAEARRLADDFRARAPGSLFLPTVQSAIDSIPMTDAPGRAN